VAPADGSGPGHAIEMPAGWVVPYNARFSPDGTRVAFDAYPTTGPGYRQILVAPADGSSPAVPITDSAEQNQEPDWKPCEGCAPPAKPPAPAGGGTSGGPATSIPQGTRTPTKVRLVYLKKVYGWHYMTLAFIDGQPHDQGPAGPIGLIPRSAASSSITRFISSRLPPRGALTGSHAPTGPSAIAKLAS
jgi:hypothetical protein